MCVVIIEGVIMSMNIGSSMMGMTTPMSMYGGMGAAGGGQNIPQYYQNMYGCADCFRSQPYLQEYPKPVLPLAKESLRPNLFQRLLNKMV